jgi:hypothetical protein
VGCPQPGRRALSAFAAYFCRAASGHVSARASLMPASSFSPLTPRHCSWCQGPLQGRSDKQFCSAACRSMAGRHGEAAPAIDWPARAHAAEQTVQELQQYLHQLQQAQQAAAPFEQRYDQLSYLVSSLLEEVESVEQVTNLLLYVTRMLHDYQQHPGLATQEVGAHQRLRNLQELHATIAKRQATLRAAKLSARARASASESSVGDGSATSEPA